MTYLTLRSPNNQKDLLTKFKFIPLRVVSQRHNQLDILYSLSSLYNRFQEHRRVQVPKIISSTFKN